MKSNRVEKAVAAGLIATQVGILATGCASPAGAVVSSETPAPVSTSAQPTKEPTATPLAEATAIDVKPQATVNPKTENISVGGSDLSTPLTTGLIESLNSRLNPGSTVYGIEGTRNIREEVDDTTTRLIAVAVPAQVEHEGALYNFAAEQSLAGAAFYTNGERQVVAPTSVDVVHHGVFLPDSVVMVFDSEMGYQQIVVDGQGKVRETVQVAFEFVPEGGSIGVDEEGILTILNRDGRPEKHYDSEERVWYTNYNEDQQEAVGTPTQVIPTVEPAAPVTEESPVSPTDEVIAINEIYKFFKPDFIRELKVDVDGVAVTINIGLMKTLTGRPVEPIKSFDVADGSTEMIRRLGEVWLQSCYENYLAHNPEQSGLTYEGYLELVKDGKGQIQMPVVDEAKSSDYNNRTWEEMDPTRVTFLYADQKLPISPTQGFSLYLAKDGEGGLVYVNNGLRAGALNDQENYANDPETATLYKAGYVWADILAGTAIINSDTGTMQILLSGSNQQGGAEFSLNRRPFHDQAIGEITEGNIPFRIKQN